jgi:hypothetical protein
MTKSASRPVMTRVCVDENLPRPLCEFLHRIWKRTEFRHVFDLGLSGEKDIPLLGKLSELRYQVLITCDFKMLEREDERAALEKSGLSLIAIEQSQPFTGQSAKAYRLATEINGMRLVFENWQSFPCIYYVPAIPRTKVKYEPVAAE